MKKNQDISVVIPVYKGDSFLTELMQRLELALSSVAESYEIILVNDYSPDDSWVSIGKLCENNNKVKGINLSRNFGQHYAITAGLKYAKGEWVAIMDCDLQDRPEEVPALYKKALEGFDSVFAKREKREDSAFKRLQSFLFYKLFSYLTGTFMDSSIGNFGIYHEKVIKAILSMEDRIRFFPAMVQWVGFRKAYVSVKHGCRPEGKSAYSMTKLLCLVFDNMIAFSEKPLKICVFVGFSMTGLSAIIALICIIMYLTGLIKVPGYGSLMLSLWFVGGMLMAAIGVVGIYIGKIFNQVKKRPCFIIQEKLNF